MACCWLIAVPVQAESVLTLSHLQHFYAGGGGCGERFWLEWRDSSSEISNIEITVEVHSKEKESITETLRVDQLGIHTADNTTETTIETPRCLTGRPQIVVRAASASIAGEQIDLLKSKVLRIEKAKRIPLGISGPNPSFNRTCAKSRAGW